MCGCLELRIVGDVLGISGFGVQYDIIFLDRSAIGFGGAQVCTGEGAE